MKLPPVTAKCVVTKKMFVETFEEVKVKLIVVTIIHKNIINFHFVQPVLLKMIKGEVNQQISKYLSCRKFRAKMSVATFGALRSIFKTKEVNQ